jgi:hypothetical protein
MQYDTHYLYGGRFVPVSERPHTWLYRATQIKLAELPESSDRQLALVEAGSFALLSVTLQLALTASELERARTVLAQHEHIPSDQVVIVPEALTVARATLLLGDGAGEHFAELASTPPSAAHPYSALFSLSLSEAQLRQVKQGLAGQRGWLAARYALGCESVQTDAADWGR